MAPIGDALHFCLPGAEGGVSTVILASVYTSHWSQTAGQMLSCCHHAVGAARHTPPPRPSPSLVPVSTNDPNAAPAGSRRVSPGRAARRAPEELFI